jgi:SAM-dependent methyltransferase
MTTRDVQYGIKSEYRFDNAWLQARERLAALEAQLDPSTIRHLQALGVGEGWHCLEVGGGGGSITGWLCRQVGPAGRVVATDINTRFLEALDFANLEVRAHNIVEDELEHGAFDLVHARGVLVHLSQRDKVLERMASALRPGGWLLVEEPDNASFVADPRAGPAACELLARVLSAIQVATGIDTQYGRRLYADVCALGLVDVGAEGRAVFGRGGGTPDAQFMRLTLTQLRDRIVGTGQVSPEELDTLIALFDDPQFVWMGPLGVAAWGRRPIG